MKLSDLEQKEREQLLQEMRKHFENAEQVRAVRKKVQAWLRKHPDDKTVLGEGEGLIMLEGAFEK